MIVARAGTTGVSLLVDRDLDNALLSDIRLRRKKMKIELYINARTKTFHLYVPHKRNSKGLEGILNGHFDQITCVCEHLGICGKK